MLYVAMVKLVGWRRSRSASNEKRLCGCIASVFRLEERQAIVDEGAPPLNILDRATLEKEAEELQCLQTSRFTAAQQEFEDSSKRWHRP